MFFKLFKQDRGAAAAVAAPAADTAIVADVSAPQALESDATERHVPAAEATPATEDDARSAVVALDESGAATARSLEAANSNVASEMARAIDAPSARMRLVHSDTAPAAAAFAFGTTADLEPLAGPVGQEQAFADLARAAAVSGPGFHIAVIAAGDLLAGEAIRDVVAAAAPRGTASDWVYVHNFADASAPVALRLPVGQGAPFADTVHATVAEALAALEAAWFSEERSALRRVVDAETRIAHDDRLNAIKTRAEAQNLAVLRTPGGYVVAPVHEGKVVKPEVFARLPEAMRADVEARVKAMQDELAAALGERPRVERERRTRLLDADRTLAREAVESAFAEVRAAFGGDAAVARHLAALGEDLVATALERAEVEPASAGGKAILPRRTRVNVFLSAESREADAGARVAVVSAQASSSSIAGHARRGERDASRPADHLDLAPGAAHRAEGGVLLVDAARLLRFPDGVAALEHTLATGVIAVEDAAPALVPEPVPLAARVVLIGEREAMEQLARTAPGLLARLNGTAHCAVSTERTPDSEMELARRIAGAVAEHGLEPFDAAAVAGLVELSARIATDDGRLSCRIKPLVDVAREADVLARGAGRDTVTRQDVEAAVAARERNLAALDRHASRAPAGSGSVRS